MRRSSLLVPLLGAALALSLSGCAPEDPDFVDTLDMPGDGWQVITADPEAPAEEDGPPEPELTQEEAIAATEKLAMDEDRFWALIDVMGGAATSTSVERLVEELAELDTDDLIAFEAQFTLKLFALDTLETARWYATHDPVMAEVGGFSDDGFLYTRCATVGSGRAAYERALAGSSLVPDVTLQGEAEDLLYAGYTAAEAIGLEWEVFDVIPLSAETGGNEEGWAEYDEETGFTSA
jgi:hypothetical protein